MRRVSIAVLVALAATGAFGMAASAGAAHARTPGCDIAAAELSWGFKESFRAYIDGSIANGEWATAQGATYETPSFSWHDGTGTVGRAVSDGSLEFAGSVRFTGHGGILDTTIANPVFRFDGNRTATLLVDVSGPTMEGDEVELAAVPFVRIDLSRQDLDPHQGTIVIENAPTELTDEGSVAFPNYEPGTEFDPVSMIIPVDGCEFAPEPVASDGRSTAFSIIVPLAVGAGIAILVAAFVIVVVLRRRRR